MKHYLVTGTALGILGAVGSFIADAFGGWSSSMTTLIIFMVADYITGIIVAGVFHKSKKSESGSLKSVAGWKGLCKKGANLLIVLIACRLDIMGNTNYIRDAVVIALCINESISLLENFGLMGVPIPSVIRKALDVLKQEDNNKMETVKVVEDDKRTDN